MKTTLFMACSINGYVAGINDDTDWVKDTEILYKLISDKGACVMGRHTYNECLKYNAFPYKNAINVVITHDKTLIESSTTTEIFTNHEPQTILQEVEKLGRTELIVVGGGNINSQFLSANLIDEIVIDVHPIIIDSGVKLFEDTFPRKNLELISTQALTDGMVQNKYKVLK